MKKLFFVLMAAMTLSFSCSKDSNDNEELVGTCWKMNEPVFGDEKLCFAAYKRASYSYTAGYINKEYRNYELKYEYNKPNIKIVFQDGSNFGSGYIEGNTLYLDNGDSYSR